MKVFLGKYKDNWVSPYTVKEKFFFWKKDYNAFTNKPPHWLDKICNAVFTVREKLNPRREFVHIDNYDVWNMDSTLALLILPMLKKLKEQKQGAPWVDDEDVPYGLRSFNCVKENEYDIDDFHFMRFDWVLDELIWTFTALHPDVDWESNYFVHHTDKEIEEFFSSPTKFYDREGHKHFQDRIDNGLRLFGKYYRALWD